MTPPGTRVYNQTVNIQADSYQEALWKALQQADYTKGFFPGHEVRATPWEDTQNPGNYQIDIEVYTASNRYRPQA